MAIITPSTGFTFLNAVNRVLIAEGIIRGDTDVITTFSDLQHGATMNMAILSIQDELAEFVSDRLIPYEKDITGTITTVAGTRSYSLATNFIRFYGTPLLYCTADNFELFEFPGGEDKLRLEIPNYRTQQSDPYSWYFEDTTTKKISFFPIPQSVKTYAYDFEADVLVTNATDLMPFHNNVECHAFCRMAARRFKMIFQGMDVAEVANDPEHNNAKATLVNLLTGKNPPKHYAPVYR